MGIFLDSCQFEILIRLGIRVCYHGVPYLTLPCDLLFYGPVQVPRSLFLSSLPLFSATFANVNALILMLPFLLRSGEWSKVKGKAVDESAQMGDQQDD